MAVIMDMAREKWPGAVREVQLGATAADGGTRTSVLTVGGGSTLPFLRLEGRAAQRPVVAAELSDMSPEWSSELQRAWGDCTSALGTWASRAVALGAQAIALYLRGAHPESGNRAVSESVAAVRTVLTAVGVPVIVLGPGMPDKDNDVLVAIAESCSGERLALGLCEQDNYRTIAAACVAHGHVAIARAPIDVNMQKQLNILITDVGLPADRIIMDPTTGALGYGLEYTYSVMERLRLAALAGDGMTQMPMICSVGEETWRTKEALVDEDAEPRWGALDKRAVAWEVITANALLHAGADIVVLRHPSSFSLVRQAIDSLAPRSGGEQ